MSNGRLGYVIDVAKDNALTNFALDVRGHAKRTQGRCTKRPPPDRRSVCCNLDADVGISRSDARDPDAQSWQYVRKRKLRQVFEVVLARKLEAS